MGDLRDEADTGTRRFREKREAILAAAAEAINEQSAKGMTFADVARRVGLNTTSVTYYFKRKEDLAAAAFEHTLDYLMVMLDAAMEASTPAERVERFLAINLARLERIADGEERPFAVLSDLRAMDEPVRAGLMAGWREVFRRTRALWGEGKGRAATDLAGARAHVLLENMFWLPVWLPRYERDQYPRAIARLTDIFRHGIAGPGAAWSPQPIDLPPGDAVPGREAFLLAATRLINELGYRGASVQRIASELNVTKGSFYHHLDAKDDLVAACYRRSFDTIAAAQRLADERGGTQWQRLCDTVATLIGVQFSQHGSLLRTTALSGLPHGVRQSMVDRSNRIARRFAGTMSDGIGEGTIRPVDTLVASQAMMAFLNAAFDMRKWAWSMPPERASALYASTLMFGLFDDRVIDG
ncbi:TetR/AcrR family transcriptional regulator [Sphingomonas corticis]|jgi:AcrR family transcriptional regulator|uniref:TetR/AcrR family transcriptional regulator n=1 Tax=Sphingomonas corticis TaxID=2722791 RepID=A0ABX1CKP0_9SPHN|nr:TetR/AcrR family transcriptional regulator [Sphingomonas corticis]NJR77483.1 TetR/AcrR family transcriptional regulator [Sphingomonas corticis]